MNSVGLNDMSLGFIKSAEKRQRKVQNGESSDESARVRAEQVAAKTESPSVDRTSKFPMFIKE